MLKRLSLQFDDKHDVVFKDYFARLKCFFGRHQMLPMGQVRMYGQASFVVECPHCSHTRWGAWEQRTDYAPLSEWQARRHRVVKSTMDKRHKGGKRSHG
jgi:hypothetical protein